MGTLCGCVGPRARGSPQRLLAGGILGHSQGHRALPSLPGICSPGWYSEAVIRGQAQLLSPHCHHRGALLGKRSRGIECGLRGSAPVPVSLPLPWQEGPGAGLGCESKAQEQPDSHGQKVPLVPTLPISPTCQLPQPHVHILSWAFAVALSMYDHLVGSDTDLSGALCPT